MSKVTRLSDPTLEALDEFRALVINNLEEEIHDTITSETLKAFLVKDIKKYQNDDNYLIGLAIMFAIQKYKKS